MSKFLVKSIFLVALFSKGATMLFGGLVDTEGNAATNQTLLGDIDMGVGTLGDLSTFIAPSYWNVSNAAMTAESKISSESQHSTNYTDYAVIELARTNSVLSNGPYVESDIITNTVRDIVTNTVTIGYTDWVYSGNTTAGVTYTINVTESGSDYVFTLYNPSEIGSVTTNVLHPTRLDFTGIGIVAECTPIIRNVNGLAMYSDVQDLETKIDTMDTSYYRVVGITNKNQSVQFVETDANTTSLQILMPESGMTKDWLVYVKALTNLTLVLPPADYWVVNESVTNEIPPLVPTALYFSQISDNTYSIGRQELIPITVLSRREIENQMIRAKMRKAGLASRNAKRTVTTSKGIVK